MKNLMKSFLTVVLTVMTLVSFSKEVVVVLNAETVEETLTIDLSVGDTLLFTNKIPSQDGKTFTLMVNDEIETRGQMFLDDTLTYILVDNDQEIIFGVRSTSGGDFGFHLIVNVNNVTSINELEDIKVNIFPNPTVDILNIESENIKDVKVFDMAGKLLLIKAVNRKSKTIDVSHLPTGSYLLSANNKIIRFIKNN